ncbi:serine/threonine-protein kinase [Thermomonospora amylolytica]|uniref:serine/threonine-protein kinase n=1 Tax=Thermomonospora amylolytica TaxID=1411117 RepID=UPI000E6BBC6F|nr:serine/threonine-protein kinase [Thermomonospora amylolytica]
MPSLPLEAGDPERIGAYRLTGRLGEGGQGVVYLGEAPDGRRVAVKVLKATSPAALTRFAREMEAAKRVAPFCTAAVLESSTTGRHPYVVSEYVEGPSLQQRVQERGPLTGGDLDRLMVNTASALTAVHGAGIVHRDLKPANVLLGPDGPRVVDFGIARAVDAETHTQMVGTPAYFAPEWLRGEPPTPASDVFAWAGTMVYAATGHPPFGGGGNIPALMNRIATEPPDLSGVPERVRGLLAECLDKDPARRPTARSLLVRLADPSAGAQGSPPPAQAPPTRPSHGHQADAGHQPTRPAPDGQGHGRTVALVAAAVAATAAIVLGAVFLLDRNGDEGGRDARTASPTTDVRQSGRPSGQGGTANPSPGADDNGGQGVPAAFGGTWKGEVSSPSVLGGENVSQVTITLTAGKSKGTAVYSDWECTNDLTVTGVTGSTVEFSEVPTSTYGREGFCIGGTVRLTLNGEGRMSYESPSPLGAGTTTGSLTRG